MSKDGSGKYDIEVTNVKTHRAFGVLFRITLVEKNALDRAEGVGSGYKVEKIQVRQLNGIEVQAIAYVATAIESGVLPYDWYKALVVAGAVEHGLPKVYIEWIRTVHSKPDPAVKRRAKNEQFLSLS